MRIIKIIMSIITVFLMCVCLTIIVIKIDKKKTKEYEESHSYIETIIVDKYYTEGYASAWVVYPPVYTLVSIETLDNGNTNRWTNNVTQIIYNSYEIGDILIICEEHEKLKEDE